MVALLYGKHPHRQPGMWEQAKEKYNFSTGCPGKPRCYNEIVHWPRDVGCKPELHNDQEAGDVFERKAFGRKISAGATKGEESQCQFEPAPFGDDQCVRPRFRNFINIPVSRMPQPRLRRASMSKANAGVGSRPQRCTVGGSFWAYQRARSPGES